MVPGAATLITPNTFVISQGSAEATTAPRPMKRLCMPKPCVR
jgi:hypothetical protein